VLPSAKLGNLYTATKIRQVSPEVTDKC